MNNLSPLAKQIIIVAAPQFAALSVGGVVGYPNVLLEQLKSNDSTFQLDLETSTWIGSTHGIAGLPSILMPSIMQWRGRKPAFIACCLIILLGWIITFLANNTSTILIAEAFHGLGTNGIIVVVHFTISEMVDPKFRLVSMSFYGISQTLGLALVGIIGRYLHWKTVGYIMSAPMFVAVTLGFLWPESPSWLAFKGDLTKCEASFIWLRGSDEDARKELKALIEAQKNCKKEKKVSWREMFKRVTRKDFYVPSFHIFVCLSLFYCSGTAAVLIYAMEIIRTATKSDSAAFYGMISIDIIFFLGCLFNVVLVKIFNNKPVLLLSALGTIICLFSVSLISYLQSTGFLSSSSWLCMYFLEAFVLVNSLGITNMSFAVAAELIPVKYRDLGGAIFIIISCVLCFASLKVSPYLFLYLGLPGTFLIFTLNASLCSLYIWWYVPETKNRSLQEIEDYYKNGCFVNSQDINIYSDTDEMVRLRGDEY